MASDREVIERLKHRAVEWSVPRAGRPKASDARSDTLPGSDMTRLTFESDARILVAR